MEEPDPALYRHSDWHIYGIFGLRVACAFELRNIPSLSDSVGRPDVWVLEGKVPEQLAECAYSAPGLQIGAKVLWLEVPEVARYLVSEGKTVLIERFSGSLPQHVQLFLLGTVFGALCFQRGLLPLHASAVQVRGGCVAFAGDSGAGKSTMAALLNCLGYSVVSDDTLVLEGRPKGPPIASPGVPWIKLLPPSLSVVGRSATSAPREAPDADKRQVLVTPLPSTLRLPLLGVYAIEVGDEEEEEEEIQAIRGVAAISMVRRQTYRSELIDLMGLTEAHLAESVNLARCVPIFRVRRSQNLSNAKGLASRMERHLTEVALRVSAFYPEDEQTHHKPER